jgi:hypothetical protein
MANYYCKWCGVKHSSVSSLARRAFIADYEAHIPKEWDLLDKMTA